MLLKPEEIKHIQQPGSDSCAATCLAMLLGYRVEDVFIQLEKHNIEIPMTDAEVHGFLVKHDVLPVEVCHGFGFVFEPYRIYISNTFGREMMHSIVFYYNVSDGMFYIFDPKLNDVEKVLPEHINFNLLKLFALYDCSKFVAV